MCLIGRTTRDEQRRDARGDGPHHDSGVRAQGTGGNDVATDGPPQVVRLGRGQRREIVAPQHCSPVSENDELSGAAGSGQASISTATLAGFLEDAEDVACARQLLANVLRLASFANEKRSRDSYGDSQPSQADGFESEAPSTVDDRTGCRCPDAGERTQVVRNGAESGAVSSTRRASFQVRRDDPSFVLVDGADGVDAEQLPQVVVLVRVRHE